VFPIPFELLNTVVVLVLSGDHRSYAGDGYCGGATPARIESETTNDARKRD
jgi:hypothetical protein